jgi:hypothetical protein
MVSHYEHLRMFELEMLIRKCLEATGRTWNDRIVDDSDSSRHPLNTNAKGVVGDGLACLGTREPETPRGLNILGVYCTAA